MVAQNSVLVDTSAWVDFFRGVRPVSSRVRELISQERAAFCGVTLYELLQGIRSAGEGDRLRVVLESLPHIAADRDVWARAGNLSHTLRKSGVTLPMSDVVIAAAALTNDLEVLTTDDHFEHIEGLKLYRPLCSENRPASR